MTFIDNMSGDCPLELCLNKEFQDDDEDNKEPEDPQKSDEPFKPPKLSTENTLVGEYFLHTLLPNMPLDHHGRAIGDILPDCIAAGIRFVDTYIDSRWLQTSQLRKIERSDGRAIKGGEDYHIAACDLNDDTKFIKDQIFEEGDDGGVVGIYMLDIPRIHNPNDPVAENFIQILADNKTDLAIFKSKGV